MRRVLEATPNLHLRQGLVVDLIVDNNVVTGVEMQDGRKFSAKAVVIATGTFLNGTIHAGRKTFSAGRAGEPSSIDLAESLKKLGFPVGRLKTGTPPRLDGRTIDWNCFERQEADEKPVPFSFSTEALEQPQIECYIGYTSNSLHEKIRANLHQSPLYSGKIKGVGPRYCPSIEDKVVKFADKDRHQLFLEPEGLTTNEVYLNGFSTSLPADLQQDLLKLIPGFEDVKIIRPGYAIEYDFVDPKQLKPTMETSKVKGLFFAGQINGTTGYEEAACQGLIAGINASLKIQNRKPFYLSRNESYIGVLVDDLIQHGVDEPYRIFTSRAEARLLLRHDNADRRLSPKAKELGLLDDSYWQKFSGKRDKVSLLRKALEETKIKKSSPEFVSLSQLLNANFQDSVSLAQLSLRQGVSSDLIYKLLPADVQSQINFVDLETTLADYLYRGYIDNQQTAVDRTFHNDNLKVPEGFVFKDISGLSNEMLERLERASPQNFGQIRKIPGLTSSALSTVLVYLSSAKS
jgi:tRNA uridine 5-carboxymethylaminomethyl modification enzyme